MLERRVIDRLFIRLAAAYDDAWTRELRGLDIGAVKDVWAAELSEFAGRLGAIAWALDRLPEELPDLSQFRALCRRAPREPAVAPAPASAPVPACAPAPAPAPRLEHRTAAVISTTRQETGEAMSMLRAVPRQSGRAWAHRIIERHERGEHISAYALATARDALRERLSRESHDDG